MTCTHRHILAISLLLLATSAPPSLAVTGQQSENAIKKAVEWLYSRQRDGHWEEVVVPDSKDDWSTRGRQWGGRTAIATYALLAAGESIKDPRIQQAITFLKESRLVGTYAIGMRARSGNSSRAAAKGACSSSRMPASSSKPSRRRAIRPACSTIGTTSTMRARPAHATTTVAATMACWASGPPPRAMSNSPSRSGASLRMPGAAINTRMEAGPTSSSPPMTAKRMIPRAPSR